MHDLQLNVRIDEHADTLTVTATLAINGEHVTVSTVDPAAWRAFTKLAGDLLGEPAETALNATETAIRESLTARAKESSAVQRKHSAAAKAWTATSTATV